MTDQETLPFEMDEYSFDHYLPQEEWDAVVAEAERILEERTREEGLGGGAEYLPLGLTPRRLSFPDTYGKNSGRIVRNQLWVNHTAECPLRVGFAESLTKWGNGGYQPRASWQMFVDPATVVTWISFSLAAFLHGPANSLGWGWEQAGYARYTRSEWLSPDGLRQMDLLAQEIVRRGIPKDAVRWLTNAQVRAIVERRDTTTRGLCDHRQIDPANRSDAGDGYPRDVFLDWIKAYHPDFPDRTAPGTPGTVRIGDRGPYVAAIQEMLLELGYAVGEPDGVAGPLFDAAVRQFQKDNGLDVDGVVGPKTLEKLEAATEGELNMRYVINDPDNPGRLKVVSSSTEGARPARDLDEADGNYIVALIGQVTAKIGALEGALAGIGTGPVDLDAVTKAAQEGAERALSDLRLVRDPEDAE